MAGKILVIYMNRPDILQIIESKHSPVIIATYKTQRKNQEWAETFPITCQPTLPYVHINVQRKRGKTVVNNVFRPRAAGKFKTGSGTESMYFFSSFLKV